MTISSTREVDRLAAALAARLKRLIEGVEIQSTFAVPPSDDICYALELFLPRTLRDQYPEWANESIDGIFVARATRTGSTEAELLGICVLITDQAVTPFAVELDIDGAHSPVTVLSLRLGEPGVGHLGISGPPSNTSQAFQMFESIVQRVGTIAWKYVIESC